MRWFNVTGICRPDDNYMLPPLPRLPTVRALLDREHYFELHAPRQVGKSTALHTLAQTLTAEGCYAAVLLSVELGAAFPNDVGAAERAILWGWRSTAEVLLPHKGHRARRPGDRDLRHVEQHRRAPHPRM